MWYFGLDSSSGMPLNLACSSYNPSLKTSPTACRWRRTSMIRGRKVKLFEISTIMTQRDTVILIEPPRKDAAPRRAYVPSSMLSFL
nr:Os02g0558200 [Ipomoea batatas]